MNERETLKINAKGHLEIGGADCVALAQEFGTPLYVFDEKYIRKMMSVYRDTLATYYDGKGMVLYASKAFSCKAIYRIADEENIGIDVVSGGELYTATQAGFPAQNICMHGNNKLDYELGEALDAGVGYIVADAYSEIDKIDAEAAKRGIVQKILLRINPGVEAHTHAFVQTATTDSKFGFSLQNGTAEAVTAYALTKKNVQLDGYHCHIGSQIFEKQSFVLAVEKCLDFAAEMQKKLGFTLKTLNMGGGFGVWYTDEDKKIPPEGYAEYLIALIEAVKAKTAEHKLPLPYLLLEPGRSIIGEAGITLYTVGAIKDIPGVRKYLAVDGGMFDNPRYALYQSKYTPILANRASEEPTEIVSIAGKCCESGDLIAVNVNLPKAESGDILAILSTGAYNYSMAMNYNRNKIPPCVLVKDGKGEYIVKPQTYEDIARNDVILERLSKKTK
ncbi:MAG: diaminopimelate decarboxylase [Clostridiales bacterium]|nr:diaminopimelate decarboxylase [Clostridiales bacterium]